jgi:putative ABC transport system ATP-binding protein
LAQVGLSDRGHHTASELSGGQQQRVAIVLVTHEEDIAAYAQRQVRFIDGHIASDSVRKAA